MQSNPFATEPGAIEPGNRILAIFDDAVIVDTLASDATWADVALRCDEFLTPRFGQLRSINVTVPAPIHKKHIVVRLRN